MVLTWHLKEYHGKIRVYIQKLGLPCKYGTSKIAMVQKHGFTMAHIQKLWYYHGKVMVSDRITMILYTSYYIYINNHCKCKNCGINTVHA